VKLRLLHALRTINPAEGGPVEGVRQLSRVNLHYGHDVEAVCLDAPDAPWLERLGIKVYALGPSKGVYGYTDKLVPWIRAHASKYDAVIINGVWQYNTLGVWRGLQGLNVPYFVFTHGMLDPYFRRRYPLKHFKKWVYWPWGVYPVLRDARAVFFTCEEERRLARKSFWLYDCDELVLSYGTQGVPDPGHDYRPAFLAKHPALAGKRQFLFLGRVNPKKGPDLLIRAVAKLKRAGKWDMATIRVVMAGPADGAYGDSLHALAKREQVEDVLYWTGMVLGDEKWGALQTAEVFVLPSHQENFGIAVVEALSAGTPVLISKPVNIWPEIIQDGAGLAEDDTLGGTVALLERWLALDAAEKATMRSRTVPCFQDRYTAERAARSLLSRLYLMLRSGAGQSSA
jgi:glycosyltransferase involved in cell wall biosynthesis